jgi:hypothetical protein
MTEMRQKMKIQKLEKKQLATIRNRNGKTIKLCRYDVLHIVNHCAWFTSFINEILEYDYNRKIPQKYFSIIHDVFHFNLQMEIHCSIEEIDPGFNLRIESYNKTISILCRKKSPDKNILFQTLTDLKKDIEYFCSVFRDYVCFENEVDSFKGYWQNTIDDW